MKLLLYGLNYTPELTGIGKYTGEMAAWLAGRGHDVRVITAPPYYPDWKIGRGYTAWRYTQETVAGVTVYRCPLWVPAKPSGAARVAHLASFAFSSLPVLLRQLSFKPDVLWTVAPAFFCAPAALAFSRLQGCPCWLHVQDYELGAALAWGCSRENGSNTWPGLRRDCSCADLITFHPYRNACWKWPKAKA